MLKFLTHKLRTHSLNEDQAPQDKEDSNHDSGTESDDEQPEDQESIMESERSGESTTTSPGPLIDVATSPYFLDSALPSDSDLNYDHHSSEEELEVINNPSGCGGAGAGGGKLTGGRSGSVTAPEKRKWSQINTTSATILPTNSVVTAATITLNNNHHHHHHHHHHLTSASCYASLLTSPSLQPQRSASCVVSTTAPSPRLGADQGSGSSDEEVQGLLAAMATPVQFRTSPPLNAHKPGRPSLSPPPKLFHYGGGGGTAGTPLDVSPRKRHRHTPRAHHIQRPCLDFEKMQQLKAQAVTTWRHSGDHGGELSVYCW